MVADAWCISVVSIFHLLDCLSGAKAARDAEQVILDHCGSNLGVAEAAVGVVGVLVGTVREGLDSASTACNSSNASDPGAAEAAVSVGYGLGDDRMMVGDEGRPVEESRKCTLGARMGFANG